MTAGGYDPNAREVWQEAFRIPPLKLVDRGVLRAGRLGARLREHPARHRRRGHQVDDRRLHDRQAPAARRRSPATAPRRSTCHMDYVIEASERLVARRDRALARRRLPRRELDGLGRDRPDGALPDRGRDHDRRRRDHASTSPTPTTRRRASRTCRPRRRSGAIRIAFLMLIDAGGIDVPTNHGLFAPVQTVFRRGLAARPALPGLDDLRQPDVRRGDRVDHARARRCRCPTASRRAGTSSSAPRSPASTRAPATPSVSLSIFMRGGPGAMQGADGFDALGFTGTPGSMRSPDMEMFELSTPHFMRVRTSTCPTRPARASGGAASARPRAGASTARTSSA